MNEIVEESKINDKEVEAEFNAGNVARYERQMYLQGEAQDEPEDDKMADEDYDLMRDFQQR